MEDGTSQAHLGNLKQPKLLRAFVNYLLLFGPIDSNARSLPDRF